MPSKRELIGSTPPSEELDLSAVQWDRITAFVGGIVALVGLLYLYPNIGSQLPVWASQTLPAIPVGLIWYGLTSWRWQTVLKATAGIAAGGLLAVYIP
ncbi:MAG: hypothetical protein J07HN6_02955 [Halonotius sp. J07HN6]|jgi:hypothetical protein|nr:MAG: hypothetical protein J07HN6_02955 [Halonotius sp. J07HN6]ESS10147.1 MAG: hypothetical protein A07HN63_00111 [uncultured archaeon A07HN63]